MSTLLKIFTDIAKKHKLPYWLDTRSLLQAIYRKPTNSKVHLVIHDYDEWVLLSMRYHLEREGYQIQILNGGYKIVPKNDFDPHVDTNQIGYPIDDNTDVSGECINILLLIKLANVLYYKNIDIRDRYVKIYFKPEELDEPLFYLLDNVRVPGINKPKEFIARSF